MATEFVWPSTLPQSPMQDVWGVTLPAIVKETQMEAGPPKRRLLYSKGSEQINVGYTFDTVEYAIWRSFLTKVSYGVTSFRWPDPRNNGRKITVSIKGNSIKESSNGAYTKVSFVLEAW